MRTRSRLPRGVLVAIGPVVLVVVGVVGSLGFGYSPWTAVAMTLLTLTTVGFAGCGNRVDSWAVPPRCPSLPLMPPSARPVTGEKLSHIRVPA